MKAFQSDPGFSPGVRERLDHQQGPGAVDRFLRAARTWPALVEEMASDLHLSADDPMREFVTLPGHDDTFESDVPRFVYYEADHPELIEALSVLESAHFVVEVADTGPIKIYRMTEQWVAMVVALYPNEAAGTDG
jgi:hypothetical protein